MHQAGLFDVFLREEKVINNTKETVSCRRILTGFEEFHGQGAVGFEGVGVRRMDEIPEDTIGWGGAGHGCATRVRVDLLHHEFS